MERNRKSPRRVEVNVRTLTPPKHEEVSGEGAVEARPILVYDRGGRERGKAGSKSCDAKEGKGRGIATNALTDVVTVIRSSIEIGMVKHNP